MDEANKIVDFSATPRLRLRGAGRATTQRTSLSLSPDLSLDEWKQVGQEIFTISDTSSWWLGDWLVYGQNRYPERYRRALAETGLDYQTLRNYAWVARRFDPASRHEGLSLQHHAEVAALPPEERASWLCRAARFGWSRNKLRQYLRASRSTEPEEPDGALLRVAVEADKITHWRHAADMSGSRLNEWVAHILDKAADME